MAIQNRARLKRRLLAIPPKLRARLEETIKANVIELNATQKAFAPKDEGDLADSVRWEDVSTPDRVAFRALAGGAATTKPVRSGADASYDYALAQELGTEDQPAKPFFYPAARVKKRKFRSRVNRAIKKGLAEAASTS